MYKSIWMPVFVLLLATTLSAQSGNTTDQPYIVENYYRIKWGHQDEFLELYKKNHYPIVKKVQELGYITKVEMEKPPFHSQEADRWDFRIRFVFKDLESAYNMAIWKEISQSIYPDQEQLKQEEQKRFELLLAHWDVVLTAFSLEE